MRVKWQSWNVLEDSSKKEDVKDDFFSAEESEASSLLKYDDGGIDTPFGRFMSDSQLRPSKRWNCWICHTSSILTDKHVNVINNTKGVAALRVLDPYTFVIGIPKEFFDETKVKRSIQAKICKRNSPKTNT